MKCKYCNHELAENMIDDNVVLYLCLTCDAALHKVDHPDETFLNWYRFDETVVVDKKI